MLLLACDGGYDAGVDSGCFGLMGHSCGAVVALQTLVMLADQAESSIANRAAAHLLKACTFAIFLAPPFAGGNWIPALRSLHSSSDLMEQLCKGSRVLQVRQDLCACPSSNCNTLS